MVDYLDAWGSVGGDRACHESRGGFLARKIGLRSMSPSPLLDVSGLAIELHGRMPVTEATFSLSEGSCIGLVGETGCGKTMTCRALTGMLPLIGAVACAGRVLLGDVDLLGLSER